MPGKRCISDNAHRLRQENAITVAPPFKAACVQANDGAAEKHFCRNCHRGQMSLSFRLRLPRMAGHSSGQRFRPSSHMRGTLPTPSALPNNRRRHVHRRHRENGLGRRNATEWAWPWAITITTAGRSVTSPPSARTIFSATTATALSPTSPRRLDVAGPKEFGASAAWVDYDHDGNLDFSSPTT